MTMGIPLKQRTIEKEVACYGHGVHSGKQVHMKIKPAPVNHGVKFVRSDLPDSPSIAAHLNKVVDTSLATVIGNNGCIISTIEHLVASFSGLSIDNVLVELDSYEVPIMDGSAQPFTSLIRSAGIKEQDASRQFFVVTSPIELKENGKSVKVSPYPDYKISCTIEFDHPLIRKQCYSTTVSEDSFAFDICPARTFGFLHEVEYMKRFGLARGGSLDNAVVIGPQNIINGEGLRYSDEFVRHKVLDCIGDFSLLGMPILGHIEVHKSGHAFNHLFLKQFFNQRQSWKTCTGEELRREYDSIHLNA